MAGMVDMIGRFHPLLVHLPIGILVYCFLQWLYDLYRHGSEKDRYADLNFPLLLGFLFAVCSSMTGLMLAQEGGFDGDAITYHKYMGFGTVAVAGLLWVIYRRSGTGALFGWCMSVLMVVIGVTGHLGGSLTHGADYLSFGSERERAEEITNIGDAHIFEDVVMPIVRKKCISCHNDNKTKGQLKMHTKEGWEAGGKHGAFLVAGDPGMSTLVQRIHLPKGDEEHMPPTGKLQLTDDEVSFLDWWVMHMSTYDQRVGDLPISGKVQEYLQSLVHDPEADLPHLDMQKISKLKSSGINIDLRAHDSKLVDVSFGDQVVVTSRMLSQLKGIAPNIVSIDLSGKIDADGSLTFLKQIENVEVINLSKNAISDAVIKYLRDLPRLRELNLYQTNISDKGLEELVKIKTLQSIYLWQTDVSRGYATKIEGLHPDLEINMGVDTMIFGTPQLMPPMILAESDFFTDSTEVSIKVDAIRSTVHYSVGYGGESMVYEGPFSIKESAIVTATASLSGWTDSEVASRTLVRAGHAIVNMKLSQAPNEAYAGDGAATLYDMKKGSEDFLDGRWLGYQESGVTAIVDLGTEVSMSTVSVGSLINHGSYIFSPIGIGVSISNDGKIYRPFADIDIPMPASTSPSGVVNHLVSGPDAVARYVKVVVSSPKYNPPWHPAPGAPCWIFLDEIIIE